MRPFAVLACLTFSLFGALPAAAAEPARLLRDRTVKDQPALLVLGSPHLANHHQDVVNTTVPDVMSAARQAQIAAVAGALAQFKPTRIAVEWPIAKQAALDQRYADYRAGRYVLGPSEVDQFGLRLAAKLNLARVDAVDWNDAPPTPEAAYDWDEYAKANGMSERLAAMRDFRGAAAEEAAMASLPVARWYRRINDPARLAKMNRAYFDYALISDAQNNPGAVWVGNWYARNLRIFANLVRLADKPGDRVLVIYGAGHAYPLTTYGRESGAFRVVDPLAHLPR